MYGYYIVHSQKKAAHVSGIDINEKHINIAKERDPTINFMIAEASELPFSSGVFDMVIMTEVAEPILTKRKDKAHQKFTEY